MTTQEMLVHLSAHDKSPRQDKESTPPKFEPQPLRVEEPVVYGRKSATHDFCLGPTSQNQRAETSSSRWACASRDRPERPRNIEENCEHVEHRQTIRNSTGNINWCSFERTMPSNTKYDTAPNIAFPGLSCASARRPIRVTHPYCELKVVTHGKTLWKNACPTTLHVSPVRSPDDDHLSKISVIADDKHLHIPRVTPNMATNHEHLPIHHDRDNVCCKEDVLTTTEGLNFQRAAI